MDAMTNETVTEEIQYIVIRLGEEQYGINIGYVDNIVRMPRVTRVPKSQPYYIGVINLRWRSGSGNEPSQTLWTGSR